MVARAKREERQVTSTLPPSSSTVTWACGRERTMSFSRRPETSTWPAVSTSASISRRAEVS
ncbi:hypothetical protein GY12_01615 [Micrococcus luteus]|nr:hypothetical protein GY12_01615 [Micrococcus luteus]